MFLLLTLLFSLATATPEALVHIPGLGSVQGTEGATYFTNRTVYQFLGIPYAEPPVGTNRFMRPLMKAPWQGVLNTTQHGEVCPQLVLSHGAEDCLFLDVHTPKINPSQKFPVLFYIHGGSFVEGTSRNIPPVFLLEHDVVLVAPQYRLGPLGFLTLGSTNKTNNAALYDVLMALQWVRDHIHVFGGDPDRITVGGISAGAGIAALLYVSPLTQDMIQQVALYSGSALALWAVDTDPVVHSWFVAEELGCSYDSDEDTLRCLQAKENPLDMTRAYDNLSRIGRRRGVHGMGGTVPIIDDEILTELPEMTLKSATFRGRPMMMSVTKDEGIFLLDTILNNYFEANNLTLETPNLRTKIADILMGYTEIQDPTHMIGSLITEKFFPERMSLRQGIVDFLGSAYFKGPALAMAELNVERGGNTYVSTFNYDPTGHGVDHASEQRYIFPRNLTGFTEADLQVVRKLTALCANFVRTGTPSQDQDMVDNVFWRPYQRLEPSYLVVDSVLSLREEFTREFVSSPPSKEQIETRNAAGTVPCRELVYILLFLAGVLYARLA